MDSPDRNPGQETGVAQVRITAEAAEKVETPESVAAVHWLAPRHSFRQPSLADAVREGLTSRPKRLPSHLFYDAEGSRLFERICDLPEYYLTRAETEIQQTASKDLAERLPHTTTLVELGSGSAIKTELLLRAFEANRSLRYAPIDVSRSALEECVARLERRHPEIEILATVAEYEDGLATIEGLELGPQLLLWLGSSIGNLGREAAAAFLGRRREKMTADDRVLVGIDLRKDRASLERAYDDGQGVTARFDLNLLTRINRELDGGFDLSRFAHRVHYDEDSGSVQSFLESQQPHKVRIDQLDLEISFAAKERIQTEDSYKYSFQEIGDLAEAAGLEVEHRYLDADKRFSLNLFAARRLG